MRKFPIITLLGIKATAGSYVECGVRIYRQEKTVILKSICGADTFWSVFSEDGKQLTLADKSIKF
ncbi:hypothetical protein ASZ90_017739 [hydrocarbon metagenome]|uniref:Uncharacterized protein n=1 Tax=hydrocarbon metagenome TaxID=938273 RepID=A0A0W8E8A3_9ZZZZ